MAFTLAVGGTSLSNDWNRHPQGISEAVLKMRHMRQPNSTTGESEKVGDNQGLDDVYIFSLSLQDTYKLWEEKEMEGELKKGSVAVLVRPLADLICVVQEIISETKVARVRYLDAPIKDIVMVRLDQLIPLAERQGDLLPPTLTKSILKQREVVFAPPKKKSESTKQSQKKLIALSKLSLEDLLRVMAGISEEENTSI